MSVRCPVCDAKLPLWKIGGSFSCPSCQQPLKAEATGAWAITIALWILADIPLYFAMPSRDGSAGLGFLLVRSTISLTMGFLIGSVVVGSLGKVSVRKHDE